MTPEERRSYTKRLAEFVGEQAKGRPMTDRPETERVDALARALREIHIKAARDLSAPWPPMGMETEFEDDAAAILAALIEDGWSVEPRFEVERLRTVDAAARTYVDTERRWLSGGMGTTAARDADDAARSLRAALGGPDATD